MTENQPSTAARRLLVGLGITLSVVAVAAVAFLFGLGILGGPKATPTALAIVPTDTPTPIPPTNTPTPTPLPTDTPTPTATFTPTPTPTPELGTSNVYVEYIFDASGSMTDKLPDGSRRIQVAQEAFQEHIASFHPETNIGFRAFGHRVYYTSRAKSCQDIELVAPVEPGHREAVTAWLGSFKPQGMTPLAESLRQAVADFDVTDPARRNSIVLFSDGEETCGGDPCQFVKDLEAQGIHFEFYVIGLNVDEPTREQLTCIADAAGGTYRDAKSQEDLKAALGVVQQDVTKDEQITPFGVDTPTPVPPTATSTPVPTDTPTPVPPTPTNTPMARSMPAGGVAFVQGNDVYVMNADGSARSRLMARPSGQYVFGFRLSPSAGQLAYVVASLRDGAIFGEIFVTGANGTGPKNVTNNPAHDYAPAWSPDGQRVAFSSTRDGNREIFVMQADGSGVVRISNSATWEEDPAWSPDGAWLVSGSVLSGEGGLVIYGADGGSMRKLTDRHEDAGPSWAPDGERIAFYSSRAGGYDVYVINVDGSGLRQLTTSPAWDGSPCWSSDGRFIFFTSDRDGKRDIYVMTADGTNVIRLTSDNVGAPICLSR